jgi:hypothetical protein
MVRWAVGAGLAIAVTLAGAACDDEGITVPGRNATLVGVLAGVNGCDFTQACVAVVPDSITQVWVKTDTTDACGVILSVDRDTNLLVREGSALRRALPAEFTAWRPVRAWVRGDVVAESCPAQGGAEAVELR